jgi:CxxC motif-containing protein
MSCALETEVVGDGEERRLVTLSGNTCRRGADYAVSEVTCPKRTLTSTVAVIGAAIPRCPVRSKEEIPRTAIPSALQEIAGITMKAPVTSGQTILPDLAGTGVPLIATRGLPLAEQSQG